jgi:uncharacterized membrane protein
MLIVLFLSMTPIVESRGSIVYGIAIGLNPAQVLAISITGNLAIAPIIIPLLNLMERALRRYRLSRFKRLISLYLNLLDNIRSRGCRYVDKYGLLGLTIFVAVPIPGSGAWAGSALAYMIGFKYTRSIIAISIGVLAAALIVWLSALGIIHLI